MRLQSDDGQQYSVDDSDPGLEEIRLEPDRDPSPFVFDDEAGPKAVLIH